MINLFQLCIRILACVVLTGVGMTILHKTEDHHRNQMSVFLWLIYVFFIVLIWIRWVFRPGISSIVDQFGRILSSEESIELQPQYSIAEARVKENRLPEALEAYQGYVEQFPKEWLPHFRIAEIYHDRLKQPKQALVEYRKAAEKALGAEAYALIQFRMADLYLEQDHDESSALLCFHEVQRMHPDSRQASAARERAERLLEGRKREGMDPN